MHNAEKHYMYVSTQLLGVQNVNSLMDIHK
jgi:hypothetical protein